jgi:hypothetical protein
MKPSLRASEEMVKALERAVVNLDIDNINGDRAVHYLRQIQQAVLDKATVQQMNLHDTMTPGGDITPKSQTAAESVDQKPVSSGPRFH